MGINVRLLRQEIVRQADRTVRPQVEKAVKLDFKVKREQFLEYFDQHDVTKELRDGPDAHSRIPAVASAGGNLFSLLGFYAEQKPVTALRAYLKKNVTLGDTRRGRLVGDHMVFETPVSLPSADEVNQFAATDDQTALEWTDRPFTSLIANGITGLPRYLFDLTRNFTASRSGPAIQVKNTLRTGSTPPINYIGDVLGYLKRLITFRK